MKYKQRGGDRPKGLKMETPKQMRQMRRAARKRRKKMQDPKRLKQAGGETGRKDGNPTGLNFMTDKQKRKAKKRTIKKVSDIKNTIRDSKESRNKAIGIQPSKEVDFSKPGMGVKKQKKKKALLGMALGAGMLKGGKERRMARRAARQEAKAQGKGLLGRMAAGAAAGAGVRAGQLKAGIGRMKSGIQGMKDNFQSNMAGAAGAPATAGAEADPTADPMTEEQMQRGGSIRRRRKKNSPYNKKTIRQNKRAQRRKSRAIRRLAEKGPNRRMYGGEEEMQRGGQPRGRGRRAGRPKMKKARRRIFKKGCKGGGCAAYD